MVCHSSICSRTDVRSFLRRALPLSQTETDNQPAVESGQGAVASKTPSQSASLPALPLPR